MSGCTRAAQAIATTYAVITILYATNHFRAASLSSSRLSLLLNSALPESSAQSLLNVFRNQANLKSHTIKASPISYENAALARSDSDLFLSKAFSNSMQPSNIRPFFYQASGEFDSNDITITTLITSNRFPARCPTAKALSIPKIFFIGPISVAVHINNNNTSDYRELLNSLHALYTSSPNMARFVDVHLVMDPFNRQFNTWRNTARLFARTDFVMMLDVDFALCTDFRSRMRGNQAIMGKLREGYSAFVVPAFEYVDRDRDQRQDLFPADKASLLSEVNSGRIAMFHASWEVGHNSTDYPRYYGAAPGEVYKVTEYQPAYEPYVVFKKEGPPWCDERFMGYGGNKAACLFEMYLSGMSFYVLSDHFILHQDHAYEERVRKDERRYNKKIYSDFKEETCVRRVAFPGPISYALYGAKEGTSVCRYFKLYHDLGILDTWRGYNIQKECMKLKGFPRIAQEILMKGPGS
ncbi:hypothetical protein D9757_006133 [Collybiopsis confluens]|uniref:Glycosyltransferase family 49 protein n=1 Tax=Collybiopsis confluens TaxID=2823264 RepID=A0A8H5HI00_9AGAR|nr:hypothetical protein D9757_006133 [Collybiopsis confluens]